MGTNSKIKILREGKRVGDLDCDTAELRSEDAGLNELWSQWRTQGFNVLGPPPVLGGANDVTDDELRTAWRAYWGADDPESTDEGETDEDT